MANKKLELNLKTYDDIFTTQEMRDEEKLEKIQEIPLELLHPFKDHPFQVNYDEEMEQMIESIRSVGTITPALARPLPDGGYELISGHRRLAACKELGMETMRVVIRDMSDDEAVITMADANLQRETILPSEKAFAYKMKLDAIKHQGKTYGQVVHKSRDSISNEESGRQVQRYIRLTNLIKPLLDKVDKGLIAFSPAVELSYLSTDEQEILLDAMELNDCTPSHSQSIRLKKASRDGALTESVIYGILEEEKANQMEKISFKVNDIKKYFPKNYSQKDIYNKVLSLVEEDFKKRERRRNNRDER